MLMYSICISGLDYIAFPVLLERHYSERGENVCGGRKKHTRQINFVYLVPCRNLVPRLESYAEREIEEEKIRSQQPNYKHREEGKAGDKNFSCSPEKCYRCPPTVSCWYVRVKKESIVRHHLVPYKAHALN
jgi:hypothetical protein